MENKDKKAEAKTNKKKFSLYSLASGKPGKKYTVKQFLELTKNGKKKPGGSNTNKTIMLPDGYVYHADSQQEIAVIKKLISRDAFKRLRGQCLSIPYKYLGKHDYYPDFVILTNTNKVVIMEVKEVAQMNSKENVKKYAALKRYCEKYGFLYLMCDKKFNVYGKFNKKYIMSSVKDAITESIKKKKCFDRKDYELLIEGKDRNEVKKIRKSIGFFVNTNKNKYKQSGDLTHKIDKFRITRIKNKNY